MNVTDYQLTLITIHTKLTSPKVIQETLATLCAHLRSSSPAPRVVGLPVGGRPKEKPSDSITFSSRIR